MFLMHAIYGFGATVSPLVSTEFVKSLNDTVYYYFAVSLGLALFTCITLFTVFRLRTEDQIVGRREPEVVAQSQAVVGESDGIK
jgi:Na+-driven multidrug efflux pump